MTTNMPSTSHLRTHPRPIQAFSEVVTAAIALEERVRRESIESLNQLLADTLAIRDLYKKHHWQTGGPTFLQLHMLFDKHADNQSDLADAIAERVQTLGGVSIAAAHDVAEMTLISRPTKDREAPSDQLSRLLHAHEVVLQESRAMARAAASSGDDGTNDLIVSQVIRTNELQTWFVVEHLRSNVLAAEIARRQAGVRDESAFASARTAAALDVARD